MKALTRSIAIAVALALISAACSAPTPTSDAPGSGSSTGQTAAKEIAWFDGSVEEAFAFASDNDKPVFLYWGAVWCPPCHYLKDKIFAKEEFVAKSRQFVPVYLDGDTERAQIWGEKLDARGYPTVIILDPEGTANGTELLRMSTDVPVDEYAEVLDLALAATRPIPEVLAGVLEAGPAEASADDLALLAFHSWEQDRTFDLATPEMLARTRRLWSETPESMDRERSRLLGLYLTCLDAQEEDVELENDERAALLTEVRVLIADPDLRRTNWYLFSYGLDTVAELLTEPDTGRDELVDAWLATAAEVEDDESLTTAERLEAFRPRLSAAELSTDGDEPLPEELKAEVRARIEWASARTTDPSELQSVMNAMAHLLRDSGQNAEAIELLKARVDDAVAPYYYMSWIGWLENDAGNPEAAIDWYRRGWRTSEGPATRLQRGVSYLNKVMDITPDDVDTVRTDALALAEEHLADSSAFAGRNARSWASLAKGLREWAGDNDERRTVPAAVRDAVTGACDQAAPDAESAAGRACRGFLDDSVAL